MRKPRKEVGLSESEMGKFVRSNKEVEMKLSRIYTSAKKVEKILEKMLKEVETDYEVESIPFGGTRVCGFEFLLYDTEMNFRSLFVYEHRSGDDIMVTESETGAKWKDVTDEEYQNSAQFDADQHWHAAKYIRDRILKIRGCDQWGRENREWNGERKAG